MSDLNELKKAELVELADQLELPHSGTKADLISRIGEKLAETADDLKAQGAEDVEVSVEVVPKKVNVKAVLAEIDAAINLRELRAAVEDLPAAVRNGKPVAQAVFLKTQAIVKAFGVPV